MKPSKLFNPEIKYRHFCVLGGKEYPSLDDARIAALREIIPAAAGDIALPNIVAHAEEVIAILSYQPNGETAKPKRPAKTYSDEDFEAARAECGYPAKILRQRVGLGWTLNEAKTRPYTRRARNATQPATPGLLEEKP